MPLLAAARQGDPIAHTSMIAMIGKVGTGLLVGAALGFLAGAAAVALVAGTVLSGGLLGVVAVAVISGLMLHAVGANSIIDNASNAVGDMLNDAFPPTVEGNVMESSPNVFINGKQAARAVSEGADNQIVCQKHPPKPQQFVAEGSATVFINGFPAHRKTERVTCDGKTSDGSPNVFVGGDSKQMREISDEMPWWLKYASLIIGVALAVCTRDWKSIPAKLGCLALNIGVNVAVEAGLTAAFGNPVHAATGAKLLDGRDDTDFALPARIPLEWVRRYNSMDRRDGLFGPGWSVPISVQLRINQDGEHPNLFIDQQGREIPFDAIEAGQSQWNIAEGWRLASTLGGSYIVEGLDGLYREFGPAPDDQPHTLALQRIEDSTGNYIALRYNEAGRLNEMADCAGRLYRCEYDAQRPNRLAAIVLRTDDKTPELALVRYTYDQAARLIAITNRAGETTRNFSWHDSGPGIGLMAGHTLPTGLESYYEWGSFSDHPRVIVQRTNDGQQWNAEYRFNEGLEQGGGQTIVTDHLGRKQVWEWNARAQITSYTDAIGRCTKLEWNKDSLLTGCIMPNGGAWKYEYDERGNLSVETDPLGRARKTTWRLDAPLPLSEVDATGRTRSYEYDEFNNLIAEDGTAGHVEIGRDGHGQPLTVIDPRGGVSRWTWHASGQPTTHEDCSGRTTRYTYDALGQIDTLTDPAGNTSSYRYDRAGRMDAIALADHSTRFWHWSKGGLLSELVDGLGQRTRFDWNRQGRLALRTDATGHYVKPGYDQAGNLCTLVNENGEAYQFDHDAVGQRTGQTGLDGMRSEYTFDVLGLPVEVKQAAGTDDETIVTLERDILGRLLVKTTPETITRYAYAVAGQLAVMERHTRNADGKPGDPIDTLAYVYDLQGNLTEEHSTQYRLKGKALTEPRTRVLHHQHDVLGNRTATELPQQRTLNYLYYGSGHLHQINLDGEVISDIERDATHREIGRSQGALLSHFQRDALGRRTAQRAHFGRDSSVWGNSAAVGEASLIRMGQGLDGDVVVKGFTFDANGELTKRVDPLLGERDYAYDALGRIISAHSPANSTHAKPPAATSAETFIWDAASNLADPSRNQGKALHNRVTVHGDRRYEYDALGRLTTKRIGRDTVIRLRWNKENQLIESQSNRTGHTQSTTYDYDAIGRRIAKHDAFGSTFFTWEGMRLLQEERGTSVATHVYEPGSYAPLARIDLQTDLLAGTKTPTEPLPVKANVYYFHTNVNGAPEEMTDGRGTVVWQARYAVWGNTVVEHWHKQHQPDASGLSAIHLLPQNLRMQGQYYDAETGLCYNTFRYYDADIGRFVSQDPIGLLGGMNLYQYAPNPTRWIDPLGWAPLSGVDFTGQNVFYPAGDGQYNEVVIQMTGGRGTDFTASNRAAGITGGTPDGYTWHHVDDFNPQTGESTMQLVTTDAHKASIPHKGSVSQYEKAFGVEYETPEARNVARKNGWRPSCG